MSTNMNFIKLAQATTVCFDVERALCDNSLTIKKLVILDRSKTEEEITQIIANVLNAVDQHSLLLNALKQKYDFKQSSVVKKVLPYDINKGTFGAIFTNNKTYVIGSLDDVLLENKAGIIRRSEEYINQGQDVYVLGQNTSGNFDEELTAVALIVVKENIRESMISSIKWLNENNVDVVVFSNDSPTKAASIAYEAGVKNIDKQISLENISFEESKNIADKYTVFGDTTKEQRAVIIETLKNKGEKVVLIDGDIDNLPKKLENSKRLTGGLYRAGLFLIAKLLLAIFLIPLLTIGYNVKAFDNPFGLYQYFVMDIIIDILAAVMLLLDKNGSVPNGKFVINALKKSLPGALVMFIAALVVLIIYSAQRSDAINLGIYNIDTAITIIAIAFMVLGLVNLYTILSRSNKYHLTILVTTSIITAILLAVSAIVSYTTNRRDPLFGLSMMEMNGPSCLVISIIIAILAGLYMLVYSTVNIVKGKDE